MEENNCETIEVKSNYVNKAEKEIEISNIEKIYKCVITKLFGKIIISIIFFAYISFSLWKIVNINVAVDISQVKKLFLCI